MDSDEVIRIAHRKALDEGWDWFGPIHVERFYPDRRITFIQWVIRTFLTRERHSLSDADASKASWSVTSNYNARGCNATVVIDDATGKVISANFLPR